MYTIDARLMNYPAAVMFHNIKAAQKLIIENKQNYVKFFSVLFVKFNF